MRLAILGSGSAGNALVVESAGRSLLIDAGFSCRRIERGLDALGLAAAELGALLLTHEHSDHVRGADRLARRHRLPIHATAGTLAGAGLSAEIASAARIVRSGEPFEAEDFCVEPFRLPHDAREPVGFVVEDRGGRRLGVVSDLGCRSRLAWGRLRDLDALVIEANHDLSMLRDGPYPWHLKQRVASRHGHLSNREAADGVAELVCDRLRTVVLYHLSRTNNQPALAAAEVGSRGGGLGSPAEVFVTSQDEATPWLEVEAHGQLSLAL